MSTAFLGAFTAFHVAISLVAIMAGFVVLFDMIGGTASKRWTAVFLGTTLATSLTGFMFPFNGFTPAIGTGIVATLVMAPTLYALYGAKMAGFWRPVYVIGAVTSLYLNVFVLIVQGFLKIPALNALAPTQKEPPFAIAQGLTLLCFVGFGIIATRKYRPAVPAPAAVRVSS
jgi:hypothetical protein